MAVLGQVAAAQGETPHRGIVDPGTGEEIEEEVPLPIGK